MRQYFVIAMHFTGMLRRYDNRYGDAAIMASLILWFALRRQRHLPPCARLTLVQPCSVAGSIPDITPVTQHLTGTPGWFARKVDGLTIVAKNGAAAGYSSQFQFAPGRGDAVIFIMNLQRKNLGTNALAHDLLREVCGLPLPGRHGEAGSDE